jgi:hypothetical protein
MTSFCLLLLLTLLVQNVACPSKEFSNCQDVTASIGIYLSAVPIVEEGITNNYSGSYNSLISKNTEAARLVDPSTMTKELLAFQESFVAAIANNELQEAILQAYRQKQSDNISPAVVIVTNTINNVDVGINTGSDSDNNNSSDITDGLINSDNNSIGNDVKNATGNSDFFNNTTDHISSGTTIDISWGEPTISTSPIAASEKADGSRKVGLATGGVIGTVLISLLFVSFLAVARRKRRDDSRRGDATIVKVRGKIKKHHMRKNRGDCDNYDQSGQKLLGNNSSYVADEEEGFTGRTMRTVASESSHTTTSSHERLVQVDATSYSSYSLCNNVDAKTTTGSDSNNSRNACEDKVLPPNEKAHGERKIRGDPIAKDVVSNNDLTSFNNYGHSHNNTIHVEASFDEYIGKYDDDEDDNENDFVLGEDDDSDSSVGQHLLSASKSSETQHLLQNSNNQNLDPRTTPQTSRSLTFTNEFSPHEMEKKTINSNNTFSRGTGDVSGSLQKSSQVPSSQSPLSVSQSTLRVRSTETVEDINPFSELDVAIANCDWVTVGATAAVIASTSSLSKRPPISRRVKLQYSSSSSVGLSDFSQKAEELDRLIEAGDWQAVVVTAAKYDVEGVTFEVGAIEEDASRSCRSRSSTQGSDTNDSGVSIMDTSSEGRNTSMGRSVTTSASQKERVQEIRTRVTQLVRDVVPDEEENVDEMMIQFKGREEDLLESLRTMKERIVARKARVESQKFARRNTRSRYKTEGFESGENSDIEHHKKLDAEIHNESNASTSITTDGSEELNMSDVYSTIEKVGSFDNSTRVDHDKAAAAAAAWAIQRSLDEMMEKEREASL